MPGETDKNWNMCIIKWKYHEIMKYVYSKKKIQFFLTFSNHQYFPAYDSRNFPLFAYSIDLGRHNMYISALISRSPTKLLSLLTISHGVPHRTAFCTQCFTNGPKLIQN